MTARIMSKPSRSEHEEQCLFVEWWRKTRPETIFAIPNGGRRDRRTAMKLKAEGVLAGVWDLNVPELRLWVEMKTTTGRLSQAQKEFRESVPNQQGWIVGQGFEDAQKKVTHWLKENGYAN